MTFIRNVQDFTCAHCGYFVKGDGYTNHCPKCLWSKHIDIEPGDRAAICGGMMEPIGIEIFPKRTVIKQRCVTCGHLWNNSASEDDDSTRLIALSKMPPPGFFMIDTSVHATVGKKNVKKKGLKNKR
ncbi:RNHCP domain-containing protein [Candidatus Uhrbacteria bacterium]|nr:RNHCP domain-containing protein [Candidatus Uhrbacteria bacterium]